MSEALHVRISGVHISGMYTPFCDPSIVTSLCYGANLLKAHIFCDIKLNLRWDFQTS
jgi:hypothetical protein